MSRKSSRTVSSFTSSRLARAVENLEPRTLFAGGVPAVSITSQAIDEPTTINGSADFIVTLDGPAPDFIRLTYTTRDGSARAGGDYEKTAGRITFAPGESSQEIHVPVLPDGVSEGTEMFTVHVTKFTGDVTLADPDGVGTIHANAAAAFAPAGTAVPFSAGSPAEFTGTAGRRVRVALRGPGSGVVTLGEGGLASVELNNTTADSAVHVTGRAAFTTFNVNGSLKSFTGRTTDFCGDVSVSGSLGSFTARNASSGGRLLVNAAAGVPLSLSLADVRDYGVVTDGPIASLRVREWTDTDARKDEITTGGVIHSVTVGRNFQADILCGTLESISVGGAMSQAVVYASSAIGAVRSGALLDSRLLAGTLDQPATTPAPDALSDFASGASSIGSVTVFGAAPGVFRNSIVAARDVGPVLTGRVGATNGGTPFGVFGDRIASVRGGSEETGGFTYGTLDAPGTSRAELDFRIRTF
jgi:hypothetical protein